VIRKLFITFTNQIFMQFYEAVFLGFLLFE